MTCTEARAELLSLAEEEYRAFAQKLSPGVEGILGVRLPAIRKLAKRIVHGDWRAYLAEAGTDLFEERMLTGFVIGFARCDMEERLRHITAFLPHIDGWAVCDSFCTALTFAKEEPEAVWHFLVPLLSSPSEFDVRFAVVMLLDYFIREECLADTLAALDAVRHEGYYVKMAVAWAVSICYVRYPVHTEAYLNRCKLDDFTYNKAIQKAMESLRVDDTTRARLRTMKRSVNTKGCATSPYCT